MHRRISAFTVALASLAALPAVGAQPETVEDPRQGHPLQVRLEGHLVSDIFASNNFSSAGVGVGWDFTPYFGVEGYLGTGFPTADQYSPGPALMANVRMIPAVSNNGRHALTLAFGGLGFVGGAWGDLAFAHLEMGYDLRLPGGLIVTAGLGADIALNESIDPRRKQGCSLVCFGSPVSVFQGDTYPHLRLTAGRSF